MYLSCQQQQQLLNLLRSDFTHNVFVDAHKRTHNLYTTIQLSFWKVLTNVIFVEGEAMIDWENWEALWPDNIYWETCGIAGAANYPAGPKTYHWPSINKDIVSNTAVFMDGTEIPEEFMVRVMDEIFSKRFDLQNITAKSLEVFKPRAIMDDLISSTDSFPAAAAYQFAQVAVFCNIETNVSEVSTKASSALTITVTDFESLNNFTKQMEIYTQLLANATHRDKTAVFRDMCMRGAEAIQAAGSAGTLPKWVNIALYAKMTSDLQEVSRTFDPARGFDPIRTVRLVMSKNVRTFVQAKARLDQLAAGTRTTPPMVSMGEFQTARVAEVAAAARELPNGGKQQREPMGQLNGQRQQWNGYNNGAKKRKFFENGRGGGNGVRRDDRHDDRFANREIHQHSAIEYGRGGKEHQGAMALVMDDSAQEGGPRTDPKPQESFGGTSDFEPGTGAKMSHNYVHEPKEYKERTLANKLKAMDATTTTSVQVDARKEVPRHLILAMPQSSSLGPGFYGYRPQLKEEDEEYDSALGDGPASVFETEEVRTYLDDYHHAPDPDIIGRTALAIVGKILSSSIMEPSRGLSTISRESSRYACLSGAEKKNIGWELLEHILPRGEVYKTVREPDRSFSFTGFYARPSRMWRESAGALPLLAPDDIESIHDACLFIEPTHDISIMAGSSKELLFELKNTIPARMRGQRMEVLWSGLPPIYRSQDWQLWVRNTMAEDHPGAGPNPSQYMGTRLQAYEGSVENIMEELGCTWFPTYTNGSSFPVGVFLHVYDDGDKEVYRDIIHIVFGSFMIHLVGAMDADLFEDAMDHLHDTCGIMAAFAGHITIPDEDDLTLGSSSALLFRPKNDL